MHFLRGELQAARSAIECALHLADQAGETAGSRAAFEAMLARIEIPAGRLAHARSLIRHCLTGAVKCSVIVLVRGLDAAACLGTAQRRDEHAVRMAAAAMAAGRSFQLHSPQNLTLATDRELADARRRLGQQRSQQAWSAGEALAWDAAVVHRTPAVKSNGDMGGWILALGVHY